MSFTIETNADKIALEFDKLRADFPNEILAAFKTLGVSIRSRIIKSMTSGKVNNGRISPLHKLTKAMYKKKGFMGKLKPSIRFKVARNGQFPDKVSIGYLNADVANYAQKHAMTEEKKVLTLADRRHWHIKSTYAKKAGNEKLYKAIESFLSEGVYNRPQRDFILIESNYLFRSGEALRIVKGRIKSIIEKRNMGK